MEIKTWVFFIFTLVTVLNNFTFCQLQRTSPVDTVKFVVECESPKGDGSPSKLVKVRMQPKLGILRRPADSLTDSSNLPKIVLPTQPKDPQVAPTVGIAQQRTNGDDQEAQPSISNSKSPTILNSPTSLTDKASAFLDTLKPVINGSPLLSSLSGDQNLPAPNLPFAREAESVAAADSPTSIVSNTGSLLDLFKTTIDGSPLLSSLGAAARNISFPRLPSPREAESPDADRSLAPAATRTSTLLDRLKPVVDGSPLLSSLSAAAKNLSLPSLPSAKEAESTDTDRSPTPAATRTSALLDRLKPVIDGSPLLSSLSAAAKNLSLPGLPSAKEAESPDADRSPAPSATRTSALLDKLKPVVDGSPLLSSLSAAAKNLSLPSLPSPREAESPDADRSPAPAATRASALLDRLKPVSDGSPLLSSLGAAARNPSLSSLPSAKEAESSMPTPRVPTIAPLKLHKKSKVKDSDTAASDNQATISKNKPSLSEKLRLKTRPSKSMETPDSNAKSSQNLPVFASLPLNLPIDSKARDASAALPQLPSGNLGSFTKGADGVMRDVSATIGDALTVLKKTSDSLKKVLNIPGPLQAINATEILSPLRDSITSNTAPEQVFRAADDNAVGETNDVQQTCDICNCLTKYIPKDVENGRFVLNVPKLPTNRLIALPENKTPLEEEDHMAVGNNMSPTYVLPPSDMFSDGVVKSYDGTEDLKTWESESGIDKLVEFVNIVDQVDQFITDKTKHFLGRLSQIYSDDSSSQL